MYFSNLKKKLKLTAFVTLKIPSVHSIHMNLKGIHSFGFGFTNMTRYGQSRMIFSDMIQENLNFKMFEITMVANKELSFKTVVVVVI